MPVVVQKYGGTSVADADKVRAVAQRVMRTRELGYDVVVVVSAMADTTDDLIGLARKISPNPDRRELDMLVTAGHQEVSYEWAPTRGCAPQGQPMTAQGHALTSIHILSSASPQAQRAKIQRQN